MTAPSLPASASASLTGALAAAGVQGSKDALVTRLLAAVAADMDNSTRALEPTSTSSSQSQIQIQAFWVPGRVEFLGKHTDYCGGESVLMAVPRGFLVLGVCEEQSSA